MSVLSLTQLLVSLVIPEKPFSVEKKSPNEIPSTASTPSAPIFPSTRFFIAVLLCLCFTALAISTSNLSVAMVCMVASSPSSNSSSPFQRPKQDDGDDNNGKQQLHWSSTERGMVFAAQNAGSLLMLFTGSHADRLNGKWTIVAALGFLVFSNAVLPMFAALNIWLVVGARLLTGFADALLSPSASSLLTRWFPPDERPFAIGLITGGRQIGTLLILPLSGFLCSSQQNDNQKMLFRGWPGIFYVSALCASMVLLVWLVCAADKPSKHWAMSVAEREFIEQKISKEKTGKRSERKPIPWGKLGTSVPLHVAVFALVCHEYPLVIMLQLLPIYINDVLKVSTLANGVVSALPIVALFLSKTISSSLSSIILSNTGVSRTTLVKLFNGLASLGLGVSIGVVPLFHSPDQKVTTIVVLCLANVFAGLHTPGVQTALLQLAPAYTGIVTGIAFGVVGIFSMANKLFNNWIVKEATVSEWTLVFTIAAVIALMPVVFFSLWGSAEPQQWALGAENNGFFGKSGIQRRKSTVKRRSIVATNNGTVVTVLSTIDSAEIENAEEAKKTSHSIKRKMLVLMHATRISPVPAEELVVSGNLEECADDFTSTDEETNIGAEQNYLEDKNNNNVSPLALMMNASFDFS